MQLYSTLKLVFDELIEKGKLFNLPKPRPSVNIKKSFFKKENDLIQITKNNEGNKKTNLIIDAQHSKKIKTKSSIGQNEKNKKILFNNKDDYFNSNNNYSNKIIFKKSNTILPPSKGDYEEESSGGLLNLDFDDIIKHSNVQSKVEEEKSLMVLKEIENSFSNSTRKFSKIGDLNTKRLIEPNIFREEYEIENDNVIYAINKSNNEKEIKYASVNLLLNFILKETADDKLGTTDFAKDFIIQHNGYIPTKNLLDMIESSIKYFLDKTNTIPNSLIFILNNFLIFKLKEEVFNNAVVKSKLIYLYQFIQRFKPDIIFTRVCKNTTKITQILDALNLNNLEEICLRIKTFSESKEIEFDSNNSMEDPIIPLVQKDYFDILEWSEVEIARQLTLITFYYFSNIQFKETLNSQWTKSDKNIHSPYITKLIQRFNNLSLWVCEEILSFDKSKYRAYAIEKFLRLAMELKSLNNFNDCFAITCALNSLPIKSLSKTWRRISFEGLKTLQELNSLSSYSKNYACLRSELDKCQGSCVPYLGYYLKELAFIDEGPKYTKDSKLINVEKIKRVGKIFESIQKFQTQFYNFKPIFYLSFLSDLNPKDENELIELSNNLGIYFIYSFRASF